MHTIKLADLNADGILDMAGSGFGIVNVRLGTGGGSFGGITSYANGTNTYGLELADVNQDGVVDLLSAGVTSGAGSFSVRLGLGNGNFGALSDYATNASSLSGPIAVGDINGDNIMDVAVAGTSAGQGVASVLLGVGNGTFGAATTYTVGATQSFDASLTDINNDSVLDLIVSGANGAASGFITTRLGTGNGTFGGSTSYAMNSTQARSLSTEDINGDGNADILTTGDELTYRLGTGQGTFGSTVTYGMDGVYGLAHELADVNGDGLLDSIASGHTAGMAARVLVRMGDGNGGFSAATSYAIDGTQAKTIAIGDLNGDGVNDILTAPYGGTAGATALHAQTVDGVSPIATFSLKTIADARQALPMFQLKRNLLAAQRSEIGAFQSRVHVATDVLRVSSENFQAAESRIRDADIASESADLTRLSILQQAASSVLAQANQQPGLALRLLGTT